MNCYNRVLEYITSCEEEMPIFIEEIKEYIIKFYDENDKEKVFNNIRAILNRNLKYKIDTKEIEERQIIPISDKINRYSEKHLEGKGENNYSGSQKELHPIGENDTGFDFTKLYANADAFL